ncbi:uncharacterized protein LOC143036669 [Oratosquilla oratoria]|uniref:uncharacterized protein LOC143036669 n=1 Tax=Oratosquilla oratoria TaxID=337810 RepID=UPI003F76630F
MKIRALQDVWPAYVERCQYQKGLPKTHKPEILLRPITSGIGSAPHKLAKRLAKPLSSFLGKISGAHLKNSSDLINKLQSIDFKDRILARFDVQSPFANVLIQNVISAIKKVLPHINGDDLPINKKDYLKLIEMCFKCASVSFDNTNISDILSRLNQVHPKIQLTVEHEVNGSLPFLDTVIIR